jgi:hypothetical protein
MQAITEEIGGAFTEMDDREGRLKLLERIDEFVEMLRNTAQRAMPSLSQWHGWPTAASIAAAAAARRADREDRFLITSEKALLLGWFS